MMARPKCMEELNSYVVKMMGDIEEDWSLSVEESNRMHDAICGVAEKLCNYPDYKK